MWPPSELGDRLGVTDPGDLAWVQKHQSPQPWRSLEQPLRLVNEEAVTKIPRTNINSVGPLSLRAPEQQARAARADRVWQIDTGHAVMITEPEILAQMLLQLT